MVRVHKDRYVPGREHWVEDPAALESLRSQNRKVVGFLLGLDIVGFVAAGLREYSSAGVGRALLAIPAALLAALLVLGVAKLIDNGIPRAVRTDESGVAIAYPKKVVALSWVEFSGSVRGPWGTNPTQLAFEYRPEGGAVGLYGELSAYLLQSSRGVRWTLPNGAIPERLSDF